MRKSSGDPQDIRRKLDDFLRSVGRLKPVPFDRRFPASHLSETQNFGSNPGALRMFSHVPRYFLKERALVVVLHGCTQSAADYDLGAGWSTLADRFGFCLLLPEQQPSNNPNRCFNWFEAGDIERGQGEACSIRQMVETMIADHDIDPARVYVTGLSAGGAMTSVMLATYPEVFAGGAIVAGLPYGAATNVQQAFQTMYQSPPRSAPAWGDLVRSASPHTGPWPKISVWHGGADATVIPSNAVEIIKQWTDVHGMPAIPSAQTMVDGYPRRVWADADGEEIIESYTITNMAHGTPLATGASNVECGAVGPFLLEVGISSSYHIARFFGLCDVDARHVSSTSGKMSVDARPRPQDNHAALPQRHVLEGEVLEPLDAGPERLHSKQPHFDVGAVINNALKAAGLMK